MVPALARSDRDIPRRSTAAVPTSGPLARIHKGETVALECVMPRLRVMTAFALIAISLLGVGVDFLAGKEPVGNSVTDYLAKSGFESP